MIVYAAARMTENLNVRIAQCGKIALCLPRNIFPRSGCAARIAFASAIVKKSRRKAGGLSIARGGFSIQLQSCFAMKGPTACNSLRSRPLARRSIARSGQRNALRAARLTRAPEYQSRPLLLAQAAQLIAHWKDRDPTQPVCL